MAYPYPRIIILLLAIIITSGCSSYQPVKNVWKSTKGLWATYMSPPASVDYEDKGDLPPHAIALSTAMLGVDKELARLERAMQNADKPPTQQWLDNLFATFPWLNGFAGVKYDGTILGQQPPDSLKELDFNPLLYEDVRQNSRALRADIQPSPLGPEVMLATPLYDGVDFLGIVVAYFDMRSLMTFSSDANDLVVLTPTALLWPGKYDFAATPLASVDWAKVVTESSSGKCTNSNGSFIYMVRYLGNLPLVFATAQDGSFPEGNGNIEQGFAFFPTQREKLPPPPLPERKPVRESAVASFGRNEEGMEENAQQEPEEPPAVAEQQQAGERRQASSNEIQPGSRDSVLLKGGGRASRRAVQERDLEGENVPVERVTRQRRPAPRPEPPVDMPPDIERTPNVPPATRPSPFGPRRDEEPATPSQRPSPFGPREAPVAAEPAAPNAADSDRLADGEKEEGPNQQSQISQPASTGTQGAQGATNRETAAEPVSGAGKESARPVEPQGNTASQAGTLNSPRESESGTDSDRLADGEKEPGGAPERPALLPGGRPSPFGPGK